MKWSVKGLDDNFVVPRAGLSIWASGPVPRGTNHSQPVGGSPHDTSFKNIFHKLLYYSLEIVKRPYITRYEH